MRMACVYFPKWPLQHARQRLQREDDSPRPNNPLALYESTAHGPRLSAVSPAAQKAGVQAGMGLADARALLPGIELVENRPDLQLQELERLALFCGRFSPHVGVEPTGEHRRYPFALLLNITGCARCFGGEDTLLITMLHALRGRGYIAQAAAAPTIGAAWALAHGGRFAAVLPSPPVGEGPGVRGKFIRIDESDLPRALEDLPIAALRLNPEAIVWLSKLGLHRISDILRQPREALPSRFGSELLQRIDQALGTAPETFTSLLAPAEFHAARALEAPVGDLPQLYPLLEKLTASLCKDLRKKARGVRELECWLYHEISDPRSVSVSFFQPTSSVKHVMELLRVRLEDAFQLRIADCGLRIDSAQNSQEANLTLHQLEQHRATSLRPVVPIRNPPFRTEERRAAIRNVEERGVVGITLRVTHNEPLSKEQLSLFRRATSASQTLSLLLDRMRTELGPENVRQVRLRSHVLPEQTVEWRPADGQCEEDETRRHEAAETPQERARVEAEGPSHLVVSVSSRPTSLLSTPVRIRVNWGDQAEAPESVELPKLAAVEHSGERSRRTRSTQKIVASKGPERIEGGWWQKRGGARRDYYVIETEGGARYFIYQDLPSGDWFLHGTFD